MAIEQADNIQTGAPKPTDSRYFNNLVPYTGTTEANLIINSGVRYTGLTVNIGGTEYWYKEGIEDVDLIEKTSSASSASGENVTKEVTQSTHGFAVKDFIGWSGSTYNKAVADGNYDGEFVGIVTAVPDVNTFSVTQSGYVSGMTGLVIDTTYFLSETTAGLITTTEPTGDGEISKSVMIANSTTSGWVFPYVGYVISTGSTSISTADNGLTVNGGIVQLGGDLCQNTVINADGNNLCLTGLPAQTDETNIVYIDNTGALATGATQAEFLMSGDTVGGLTTYVDATTICSQSGITFNANTLSTPIIKITTDAASGCVLTSGSDGTASWTTPATSATDLAYTTGETTGTITSSSGTDAVIPAATTSLAGLMVCADKSKLDGIESGAQTNVATDLVYTTGATTGTVTSSTGTDATISAATTNYAGVVVVDSGLTTGSTNPVQNGAVATVLNQILVVIAVAPTYTQPSVSVTNVTQVVEMGTTLTDTTVNTTFTQNDAGSAYAYELCRNAVHYSSLQNNTVTDTNITSAVCYVGKVGYACGITKDNNLGIPDPTGKILAGSGTSATRTITPYLRQFWGGGVDATTSAQVRALTGGNNYSYVNSWTANINDTTYIIAIPATKTMTSALTSGNEQIVSNFTSTTFDVDDAGGNPTSYKVYKLDTALPLNLNTVIIVT